jgi:hypothetical protein
MTKEYKGFLDEAIKLGADGKSVQVTITNKETYKIKDNYISVGAELMFEFGLPKDGDIDAIGVALDAYTRAAVEHSIRDQKAAKGIIAIEQTEPSLATEPPETPVAASGTGFGPPATETAPALEETEPVEVVKFTLARRTDQKFQLELYQMYGQSVGRYAEIKYVASREDMWNLIGDFVQTFDLSALPIEETVSWYANWSHGREFTNDKGETKRYKDLTGLKQR